MSTRILKGVSFCLGFCALMATARSGHADQDWTNWKKILATDYSDRRLGEDSYSVDFTGRQVVGEQSLRDLMTLHCSQLALSNGYRFFRVVDGHDATGNVFLYGSGISRFVVSLHFPTRSATIQLRPDKQGPQDIDATQAATLLRKEYDLSRTN